MEKTNLVTGTNGGTHLSDGPMTVAAVNEAANGLLRSEIDQRVTMIRPMSTPVDQISRMVGARPASSMVVDYYSVDTKPVTATLLSAPEASTGSFNGVTAYTLDTDSNTIFARSETLLIPSVKVSNESGAQVPLMLFVTKGCGEEAPVVVNVNGKESDLRGLAVGTEVVRMGRAASELEVQTPQFDALPVKSTNYCQIFKAQIEQSLYAKLSAKEVGWTFSDQEEVAVMDMRMGMEKNFLFGSKARLSHPTNYDDVLMTEGIWNQTDHDFIYDSNTFSESKLIKLMREAFTGEAAGSSRKILIGGSGFMELLSQLDYTRVVSTSESVSRWGISFTELHSKFGQLYVVFSEVFDQCGHPYDGMVIDPEYMTKYVHVPFHVDLIDLQSTGTRNTQALVATEASCLVLRHPKAHMRIICDD